MSNPKNPADPDPAAERERALERALENAVDILEESGQTDEVIDALEKAEPESKNR